MNTMVAIFFSLVQNKRSSQRALAYIQLYGYNDITLLSTAMQSHPQIHNKAILHISCHQKLRIAIRQEKILISVAIISSSNIYISAAAVNH